MIASFDDEPALATGFKQDSVDRARLVVATALAQLQANEVPDRISDAASAIKVIKRSMDETPFYVKGATSREITRVKALNQRCFFRWGREPEEASRVIVAMCEMISTDALSMLEAFERMLPEMDTATLNDAPLPKFPTHVTLGDALSANKLFWLILVHLMPNWLHIYQLCEAHQANLIITHPFEQMDVVAPLYAFSKMMRIRTNKKKLADALLELATDVDVIHAAPSEENQRLSQWLYETCVVPVLKWMTEAEQADVLPRVAQQRKGIAEHAELFRDMFNAPLRRRVAQHSNIKRNIKSIVNTNAR